MFKSGAAASAAETTITVTDNQSTLSDITGLSIDGSIHAMKRILYSIYRTDASSDHRRESGILTLQYNQGSTTYTIGRNSNGDDALNNGADSIDINSSTGQVQYKSDSMGGTYTGKLTFELIASIKIEA